MDEPTPESVQAPAFKDRHAGLILCGIVLVLAGIGMVAMTALMAVGLAAPPPPRGPAVDVRSVVSGIVFYLLMAVVLVWLGVGSILARRWARALALVVSWLWLLGGVISAVVIGFVVPGLIAHVNPPAGQALPDNFLPVVMTFVVGCVGVLFVIVPGLLVLFYRSPHVKATCDARDPQVRWTDVCPPAILGLSLALALGAVTTLPMALLYQPVIPFFGALVTGWPALLALVAGSGFQAWAAGATYSQKSSAWWAVLVATIVVMASSFVTFMRVDLLDFYRAAGYQDDMIAAFERIGFGSSRSLVLWSHALLVPLVGYMVSIRKLFR